MKKFSTAQLLTFIFLFIVTSSCKDHVESSPENINISMMIWGDQNLSSPINLKVSSELLAEFSAEDYDDETGLHPVEQMMLQWDQSYPRYQFFNIPTHTTSNKNYARIDDYYDSEMGVYISHEWFAGVSSQALAITQFYGVKKSENSLGYLELVHADIILNYRYHSFSTDPKDYSSYHLPSVLLHELGHLLGMTHQRNYAIDSVMKPFMNTLDINDTLQDFDKSTLINNYNKKPGPGAMTFSLPAISTKHDLENSEIVRGVVELRSDGKCYHYVEGKLIEIH